ncbi:helix-turn-helix transcriptional regulator [Actinomycetospora sp. CA-101289]|uniref:helix-turn-helix transcriptional regulator n=1 Tax=Actinomycetospora sp. CA-101289 TaxID=3239893 RepID=UPI003D98A2F4
MGGMQAAPEVPSSFVGRASELKVLVDLIERERWVTLLGPGGSGKTRLAVEAARRGVLVPCGFVELAGVDAGDDLAATVLAECGIWEDPERGPLDRLADRWRDCEDVLVLDNCEQVRDEVADLVGQLLRRCPRLRVVLTSRVATGGTAETILAVGGLPVADIDADGVVLFLDRARRVQPGLPAGPASRDTAWAICRLTDGLPLAIELAAAHALALSLPEIEAGMADRTRFLVSRDPGAIPQHRSLQACVAWSVDLAGARAGRALAALSVLGGRFSLGAALAVTADERAVLETLVAHSLVVFTADDGRYLLLDTIREHARRTLAGSPEVDAVHDRLVDWAADLAQGVSNGLDHADPEALHRVDRDESGLRAALEHAAVARPETAAGIVVDLAFAWSLRGRCAVGRDHARRVGDHLADPPHRLAWATAFLTAYAGDMEAGVELALAAADLAAEQDDPGTRGRCLILVGMIVMFVDPAGAHPVLTEAVALADAACDDWGRVEGRQMLAYCHLFRSEATEALSCVDASAAALERLGHDQLWAWDDAIRAELAVRDGRLTAARDHARRGLDRALAVQEPVSTGGALMPLVRALVRLGRAGEASELVESLRPFFAERPAAATEASLCLATAITACWADPAASHDDLKALRDGTRELPSTAAEIGTLLAVSALARGDRAGAVRAAGEAANTAAAIGDRGAVAAAELVRCAAERPHAGDQVHVALADLAALGLRVVVPDALDLIAGKALDAGRPGHAARLHTAADRIRQEDGAERSPLVLLVRPEDERAVAEALDTREAACARIEGARLDLPAAVAYAARARGRRQRPRVGWDSLTPTEQAVAELVGRGLSNRVVGEHLLIAVGTVRTHLRSVFGKLGVTGRTELAARLARLDR